MNAPTEIRFELHLNYFPNDEALQKSCQLIYRSQDKNLLASLSSTPYIVGRSFSRPEQEDLTLKLREIGVAFSFKSKPPFTEEISFDPRASKSEEPIKAKINLPIKGLLWAGLIVGFGICVWVFLPKHLSFNSEKETVSKQELSQKNGNSPKNREPTKLDSYDAKLDVLKQKVEFREASELFWKLASSGLQLEFDDAVRTYSNADAVLKYRDGSFVRMRENTLLVVGETKESAEQGTERSVELKDGSLQARLQASDKKQSLAIQTAQGTLEISNQQGSEPTNTQITTSLQGGKLEISVREGQASFQSKQKEKAPIQLKKNQSIVKTPDTEAEVVEFIGQIDLIEPPQNHAFKLSEAGKIKYKFEWESLGEKTEYEWSLFSNSLGKALLLSQKTQSTTLELNYLDPGELYWRVEAEIDGIKYESPLRRIYVEKHDN